MKKAVSILLMCGLFFLFGYFVRRGDVEIIEKVDIVTVEGKIKYKTIIDEKVTEVIKPYTLVLNNISGEWELDTDLSYIPQEMSVDSVKHDKKIDWLSPVRVGLTIDKKPVLCYNIANIKGIETGVFTDFESFGVDIGYGWRNLTPFVGYTINGEFHFGIAVKIF